MHDDESKDNFDPNEYEDETEIDSFYDEDDFYEEGFGEDGFDEDDFDEIEDEVTTSPAKTLLKYMLVVLTLLSFITLTIASYWPQRFSDLYTLIISSADLKKDLAPEIMDAVVKIEADIKPGVNRQRQGTGFNISPNGVIVSNHHVVADAVQVKVYFGQNKIIYATNWSSNPELDLALIFLDEADLPTLQLSDTDPIPQQEVTIIGNPLGVNQLATTGVVLYKAKVDKLAAAAIAIKAPIYPGNSGSPVLNEQQQVIGVIFGTVKNDSSSPEDIVALAMPVSQLSAWADNNSPAVEQ